MTVSQLFDKCRKQVDFDEITVNGFKICPKEDGNFVVLLSGDKLIHSFGNVFQVCKKVTPPAAAPPVPVPAPVAQPDVLANLRSLVAPIAPPTISPPGTAPSTDVAVLLKLLGYRQ